MIDRSISKQYRWKVKSRLAVLEYVNVHGLKPAATRFALDRKTIRAWRDRAREAGAVGLVPRYPARRARRIPTEIVDLIAHARRELQYGACRTRIWLLRVHQVKVATKTITRMCDDLGPASSATAEAAPRRAPAQALREGHARRVGPGGRQGHQARQHQGLSVHRV